MHVPLKVPLNPSNVAPHVTVLGPERPDPLLPSLVHNERVALVSAGWRYDEDRDEPLRAAVGGQVDNLRLYWAFRELERTAPELIAAYSKKQATVKAVKARYRDAIVSHLAGMQKLWSERRDRACPWFMQAMRHMHEVDALFLAEADRLHAEFGEVERPWAHPAVKALRERMIDQVGGADVVLIAGGHVGVLRNRMAFFGIDELIREKRVVAWSAGAMVLAERILLFHDRTTHGVGLAEYLDRGFGLVRGVVFLPHAEARLDLSNTDVIAVLAARLSPLTGITLQNHGGVATDRPTFGRAEAVMAFAADGTRQPYGGPLAARA